MDVFLRTISGIITRLNQIIFTPNSKFYIKGLGENFALREKENKEELVRTLDITLIRTFLIKPKHTEG